VWGSLVASFRFVSLASICAVIGLPLAILALGYPPALAGAGLTVAAIVVSRHHENIRRLLAGTEGRFGDRAPEPAAEAIPPGPRGKR
jgi:glycerol-3-phosphate acyltransferase PlsY